MNTTSFTPLLTRLADSAVEYILIVGLAATIHGFALVTLEPKPIAEQECLLIEPAGTVDTGDAGGELKAAEHVWI